MRKFLSVVGVGSLAFLPGVALADMPPLSGMTGAISFDEVGTAILAVGVALAGVYVLWKGAGIILRAIRGM